MCGISLIWKRDAGRDELSRRVERMISAQARRGPDVSRTWVSGSFALGHSRLRVLDLDPRGDQPFGIAGHDERLVYAGEIYNWRELRDELAATGITFVTSSDTEVLYQSLLRWDEAAVERLHGMYAFALCRPARADVLLARDRLGQKPLQWATTSDALVVASEVKGVVASGLVGPELDAVGVLQAFRHNHMLGETTAVASVRTLQPGSVLRFELPELIGRGRRWWRPQFSGAACGGFRDRVADLDGRFARAVRSHLVADVPVASYLSGGLDSSGITAEAHRAIGDRLAIWSLVFPGDASSEERHVDAMARALGAAVNKVSIERVTLDEYADYVACAEMPQWWTSDLALKRLAAAVSASGGKVVLAGEGPDELLAGYDAYRGMKLRRVAQWLGAERALSFAAVRQRSMRALMPWMDLDLASLRFYFERHARVRRGALERAYGFYPENTAMWDALVERAPDVLSARARGALAQVVEEERAWFRSEIAPHVEGASVLHANLYYEVAVRLPSWVLHMGDRMSAAHGVELRLPYLDDEVVEGMLALPERDRLRGLSEKHILRAVHRGRVPESIRRRRKQPLYTPIRAWLGDLGEQSGFARYWSAERFAQVGLFDFDACERRRVAMVRGDHADGLDRMVTEWAVSMALSTHVLDTKLREATNAG